MSFLDQLFSLEGRVVVVTGGSRGLGKAIALGCARAGADVVIASRKIDACRETAAEIEVETGRRAWPYAVHVGRWDQLEPFVDAVYAEFGRIDVLVNNAGMAPRFDKLSDVSEQLFDSTIGLNFKGPFRLSSLVGERMAEAGHGSIINVSSTGSLRPYQSIVPYASAKAAINSMTRGMAEAFGPTVRVNTLMSGTMRTDIAKHWDMDEMTPIIESLWLKRVGEPHEVIGTALYLASDASSYTTGATIRVDGGIP